MANTKTGALPLPKFGAAAGNKPKAANVPLTKASKEFMPPAKKPPKRKFAFKPNATTAYDKG